MCCSGAELYYAPFLAFKYQFASEDNICGNGKQIGYLTVI